MGRINKSGGDQAAGLRRLFGQEQVRIVTFAAGGENVGKTTCVANLAVAFAAQGKEVLLIDENAHRNSAGHFAAPHRGGRRHDLYQVVCGEKTLAEVVFDAAPGVRILPVAQTVQKLSRLSPLEQEKLLQAVGNMERPADIILVDATTDHPLGFSPFGLATQETVIVLSTGSDAITSAYALIKKVSIGYARRNFHILVNRARDEQEAGVVYGNLARVAAAHGVASLDYLGYVPRDDYLRQSCQFCRPVLALCPEAPSAQTFRALAAEVLGWPAANLEDGGFEQFVQQLLHLSQRIDPIAIYSG
ncbi:MAG: AAA family ATPase [Betaproteobacteria bacterium]|nr:AAA family ATPase [Betaproteobacteria bacterium]